nr:uncharacterized protein LOC129464062 isoform X2 [Symphalangus syndactylus]
MWLELAAGRAGRGPWIIRGASRPSGAESYSEPLSSRPASPRGGSFSAEPRPRASLPPPRPARPSHLLWPKRLPGRPGRAPGDRRAALPPPGTRSPFARAAAELGASYQQIAGLRRRPKSPGSVRQDEELPAWRIDHAGLWAAFSRDAEPEGTFLFTLIHSYTGEELHSEEAAHAAMRDPGRRCCCCPSNSTSARWKTADSSLAKRTPRADHCSPSSHVLHQGSLLLALALQAAHQRGVGLWATKRHPWTCHEGNSCRTPPDSNESPTSEARDSRGLCCLFGTRGPGSQDLGCTGPPSPSHCSAILPPFRKAIWWRL